MHFSVDSKTASRIRSDGRYERGGIISLRYISGDGYRYSAVVSKKQGTAVRRNRIKRVIREVMRAGEGVYPPGFYLVYFNRRFDPPDRRDISANIDTLMKSVQSRIKP